MKISSARRAGPQFNFYECGPDRENSFVILPKSMIDMDGMDKIKADWQRAVAFGPIAEIINDMVSDGVTLFKLAVGRIRNNDLERDDGTIFKSAEIVVDELEVKNWNKIIKQYAGKGIYKDTSPNAA